MVCAREVWRSPWGPPAYTTIGSMLGSQARDNYEVWGSGFISSGATPKRLPLRVHAVRGPLSRNRYQELGVDVPEVFGDPLLLAKPFFEWVPEVARSARLGVVPHFREKDLLPSHLRSDPQVNVIDIESGLEDVWASIGRCEAVVSGSLHGLVAADAHGIPAGWIRLSDRPAGDGFKFRDHLTATGRTSAEALTVDSTTTADELLDHALVTFEKYHFDPGPLVNACPIADTSTKRRILQVLKSS